jgi:hypothetical protein
MLAPIASQHGTILGIFAPGSCAIYLLTGPPRTFAGVPAPSTQELTFFHHFTTFQPMTCVPEEINIVLLDDNMASDGVVESQTEDPTNCLGHATGAGH